MDETENQQTTQNVPSSSPRPSYTTSGLQPKKKSPIWILMVIALLLIGGGIFFLVKRGTSSQSPSPTPETLSYTTTDETETTPEPTPTQKPVDKASIKIQILNGTGIAKGASYLQGKLRSLGYTQIDVGNAENETYEATEVYFSSTVPDEVVSEISAYLEKTYEGVKPKTGSTGKYDIKIITGLQKGATSKPLSSETSAPASTSTPKPTTSSSPAPTATP